MLSTAFGKPSSNRAPTRRMKPARQTRPTWRWRSSCASLASKSSRVAKSRWLMTRASIPALRARSSPPASARFEMTTTMRASSSPRSIAPMSAWRLLPRPEMSTPRRRAVDGCDTGLSVADTAAAVLDGSNLTAPGLTGPREIAHHLRRVFRRAHHDQPDAHVERAQHVVFRHTALALEPPEDGRHAPRAALDDGLAPFREHSRQVVSNAAASDVRHPLDAAALEQRLDQP